MKKVKWKLMKIVKMKKSTEGELKRDSLALQKQKTKLHDQVFFCGVNFGII